MDDWISDELREALSALTSKQAMGVIRIAQARAGGRGVNSLLSGDDPICARTTYYGRPGRLGWLHKPEFTRAVELAERDFVMWLAEHAMMDTLAMLKAAAPKAARELARQIAGDTEAIDALCCCLEAKEPAERKLAALALGQAAHGAAVLPLIDALERERAPDVREAMIEALGMIAAAQNPNARLAAASLLDRAGTETAEKSAVQLPQIVYRLADDASLEE